MERYICIHGHFYQPPRENAWLEYLEIQDSAYPYHDWNERISDECYMPNASSRILNGEGFIEKLVNNYTRISFNFGPTLLNWMEKNDCQVYKAILEADQLSRKSFSGHGSAMAQAYNHIIMPLANRRDRYSQVIWGIRDFEYRFRRKPEGMWLPETAVDIETLDIMAEKGITFTILSPHQAKRVRRTGRQNWRDVSGGSIDPTRAYRIELPSGRKMNLFFYDGPISRAIAFEDVLKNGENFAKRLVSAFSDKRRWAQIVNIASDGETYGHHHRFADMALAYTLQYIEANKLARITNYSEYLERCPPEHEVEIIENTSWSCAHGIERWRSDCGDTTGSENHKDWNQKWRKPLRNAFDWLRDTLSVKYEQEAQKLVNDPWLARDDYIEVILNRSKDNVESFITRHARTELDENQKTAVLKLMELQRHAMLMYTSCGWFFDEISRPEPIQVIQYAGRAIQLAQDLFGDKIEEQFLKLLEQAKSNIPEQGNGRKIYNNYIRPAIVDLPRVVGHYTVDSIFRKDNNANSIYCYRIQIEDSLSKEHNETSMVTGRSKVTSMITGESAIMDFGAFQAKDKTIHAGVRYHRNKEAYQSMMEELSKAFFNANAENLIPMLEKHFSDSIYTLESLFRDEQQIALGTILYSITDTIAPSYWQLLQYQYSPVHALSGLGEPIPSVFRSAAELILSIKLDRAIGDGIIDIESIRRLIEMAKRWEIELDANGTGYKIKKSLEKTMRKFSENPGDQNNLNTIVEKVSLMSSLPFPVDLCRVQQYYWQLLRDFYPNFRNRAAENDNEAIRWLEAFVSLGKQLYIKIDDNI